MPLQPQPSPAQRPRSDCIVLLGVTGDLALKKLLPAVYRLTRRGLLGIPVVDHIVLGRGCFVSMAERGLV